VNQGPVQKTVAAVTVVGCFAVLAWLNGRHVGATNGQVAIYAVMGAALALLGLVILAAANLAVRSSGAGMLTYSAAWGAVVRGSLVVLPLAVLALMAELAYGWQAAAAFVQGAVMISGAAAGAELLRQTGGKTRHLVTSLIVAFVFCAFWVAFSYVFQRVAA
jgi:hypothetical protein